MNERIPHEYDENRNVICARWKNHVQYTTDYNYLLLIMHFHFNLKCFNCCCIKDDKSVPILILIKLSVLTPARMQSFIIIHVCIYIFASFFVSVKKVLLFEAYWNIFYILEYHPDLFHRLSTSKYIFIVSKTKWRYFLCILVRSQDVSLHYEFNF